MIAAPFRSAFIAAWIAFLAFSALFGFSVILCCLLILASWFYRSFEREPECSGAVLCPCDGIVDEICIDPASKNLRVVITNKLYHQGTISAPIACENLAITSAKTCAAANPTPCTDFDFNGVLLTIEPLWPSKKIHLFGSYYDLLPGKKLAHVHSARIVMYLPANTSLKIAINQSLKAATAIGRIEE